MTPDTQTNQDDAYPLVQHVDSETEEQDKDPKGDPPHDTGTTTGPDPIVARGDAGNADSDD